MSCRLNGKTLVLVVGYGPVSLNFAAALLAEALVEPEAADDSGGGVSTTGGSLEPEAVEGGSASSTAGLSVEPEAVEDGSATAADSASLPACARSLASSAKFVDTSSRIVLDNRSTIRLPPGPPSGSSCRTVGGTKAVKSSSGMKVSLSGKMVVPSWAAQTRAG